MAVDREELLEEMQRQRKYLSSQLEEAAKDLARADLVSVGLTREKRLAMTAFNFIMALHQQVERAHTTEDLYQHVVKVIRTELVVDCAAILDVDLATRMVSVLAAEGLAEQVVPIELDRSIDEGHLLEAAVLGNETAGLSSHRFVERAFDFPLFVWYPMESNGEGLTVLYAGSQAADHLAGQPFSELTVKIFGAIASTMMLRKDSIEKTRRRLKRREDRIGLLTDILLNAPLSVLVTDPDGRITNVNRAAERLYGLGVGELDGAYPWQTSAEPDGRAAWEEILQEMNESRTWRGELLNQKRNGETIHVNTMMYPLADQDARTTALIMFQEDVTERKRAEKELRAAKQEAESANNAKDEFLARMSHEIRTPMNAVIGMTHLLAETALGGEQREYVEIIRQSAESLLSVINDILDYSRIAARKLKLEILDFDLESLISGILDSMMLRGRIMGLDLAYLIDPSVPTQLRGDSGRLRQILVNLLGNAIKFTNSGSVLIRVFLATESDDHVTLRFNVSDTGIGIAEDRLGQLFQPFSQIDNSGTRYPGGSGLGLVICRQLAELMGGQIGVQSEEGAGSTFWFTAVFQRHAPGQESMGATGYSATTGTRHVKDSRRWARILIAEDNPVNRLVALKMLEKLGFRADTVDNGQEAVAALTRSSYDLVLMDVEMPVLDGLKATQMIRDPGVGVQNPNVPIIAMTAHAMKGARERCFKAGMDGYVTKPVNPEELRYTVERQLFGGSSGEMPAVGKRRASSTDPLVFDRRYLLERLSGDEELETELLSTFLHNVPENVESLRRALASDDPEEAGRVAHIIRASSVSIGACALSDVTLQIEKAATEQDLAQARALMSKLEREVEKFKTTLQQDALLL
jgi:PAS domain S-box-containing protein